MFVSGNGCRSFWANEYPFQLSGPLTYWGLEYRFLGMKYSPFLLKVLGRKRAEAQLKRQVHNPELRKKLTPDFPFGCKRVLLSNDYYPSLCRENVRLLTREQGIGHFTELGIHTLDGQEIQFDLVVFATGFDAREGMISYPVFGKGGKLLSEVWSDFPRAYLGTCVPGFPNLFFIGGPNTGGWTYFGTPYNGITSAVCYFLHSKTSKAG